MHSDKWLIATLRALANQGLIEKRDERLALAATLETVTRMEARMNNFLNRADVLLSQSVRRTND